MVTCSVFPVMAQDSETGTLVINIAGIHSDEGQIHIAVFNTKKSWMKAAVYESILDIEERSCNWLIEDVPYGEFAVAVFHDENGNGKHDKNFFGKPKEPYGFSNNARGRMGPPGWDKTQFTLSAATLEVEIKVK